MICHLQVDGEYDQAEKQTDQKIRTDAEKGIIMGTIIGHFLCRYFTVPPVLQWLF